MFLTGRPVPNSPYLDLVLKDRGEKLLAPGSYPHHDIVNEEALMIYECSLFHGGRWSPRGSLTLTLNYIRFFNGLMDSTCKWGSIENVEEGPRLKCEVYLEYPQAGQMRAQTYHTNLKRQIIFKFIDGTQWNFSDFFVDFKTALTFLRSFYILQKDAWGICKPFSFIPFYGLYAKCLARCTESVTEYVTEYATMPTPRMPPARPTLEAPAPYNGDDWLKQLGGQTPNVKEFVDPFVVGKRLDKEKNEDGDASSQSTADQTPTLAGAKKVSSFGGCAEEDQSSTTK